MQGVNGFYEEKRESGGLCVNRNTNHIYPPHFHLNLEVFIVRTGAYRLVINGENVFVRAGSVALIDSYDIHAYEEKIALAEGQNAADYKAQDDCVVIIPFSLLQRFTLWRRGRALANPVIEDENLCDDLLDVVDRYLLKSKNEGMTQAAVDLFLSLLMDKIQLKEQSARTEAALVRKILCFIEENYKADASRARIARELGYAEAHISRVFHRYMQTGISAYVNALRLAYVEGMQKSGDERTLTELIFEAGFSSQQTYYRVKKQKRASERR